LKATETSILEFLQQPMQLIAFDPRRNYHWMKKECQQLWDDIVRITQDEATSSHYLGAVVYVEYGVFKGTQVSKLILLDGQQRLVTICLLLAALSNENAKERPEVRRVSTNDLLFNGHDKEESCYKLIPSLREQDTFFRIIKNESLTSVVPSRLTRNYQFFINNIRDCGIRTDILYKGISKLTVMDISTDRKYENPKTVYDSIMATGLDKTQAGLIRNWLGFLQSGS